MNTEASKVKDAAPRYRVDTGVEHGPSGYKRTEVGLIPEDWAAIPLWDIAKFTSGDCISVANLCEESSDSPVPVFGGNGVAGYTDRALVSEPTVVLGRVGQKCGAVYLSHGPAWITDNALFPRHLAASVHIPFLALALENAGLNSFRNRNDLPLLTQGILRSVRLGWPATRTEQEAIADALSDVDGLLGSLEVLIAKKRAIKQAAMQQLLTGKTRLPGFNGPWETKRLGEITSIRNEKVMPSSVDPDTPCVELEHIGQGDGHLMEHSTARDSISSKYRFRAGDVLFGRLRSYLRKYWLADRDGICTTEIWPLMVHADRTNSGFLLGIVQSDSFIESASISYGTHMPRADWSVMQNFEIRVPEIHEQAAIATVFSDMDDEIAALERRRDKTRAIKQGMMQQLLTGRVRLV